MTRPTRNLWGPRAAALSLSAAALVAWPAGPAAAVAVPMNLHSLYSSGVQVTPSLTGSGGRAGVNSVDARWVGHVYEFGGSAYTAAVVTYNIFGASGAGLVTMHWPLVMWVPGQPAGGTLEMDLDWQIDLFGSHSAIGGVSSGAGKVDIKFMQIALDGNCAGVEYYFVIGAWCPVSGIHHWESGSSGSGGGHIDLGAFDTSEVVVVDVTFKMATVSQTYPLFGLAATGFDLGILGFSLWADDGTAPPPVPEPPGLALVGGALGLLALRRRPMALRRR